MLNSSVISGISGVLRPVWLAGSGGQQQAQALQVVAPVEVVDPVVVVTELGGVVLGEPQPRPAVRQPGQLERERVVLPVVMSVDAAPHQPLPVYGFGDLHDRVEVAAEDERHPRPGTGLLDAHLRGPPARQPRIGSQRVPHRRAAGVYVQYMMNGLHPASLAAHPGRRLWRPGQNPGAGHCPSGQTICGPLGRSIQTVPNNLSAWTRLPRTSWSASRPASTPSPTRSPMPLSPRSPRSAR